jgi:hypothetical protein
MAGFEFRLEPGMNARPTRKEGTVMRTLVHLVFISGMAAAAAAAAGSAELYKWVDERGITNYSSDPPPKGRAAKPIADDRVSTYTPDQAVTEAIEAERTRRTAPRPAAPLAVAPPPPPPGSAPPPASAPARAQGIPSSTAIAPYDPCLVGGDPNCSVTTIYDGSPVFQNRTRAPVLNQPQLPQGAIAGNVNGGGGVTPGLSGLAPPLAPPPQSRGNPRPRSAPLGREPLP